jgi:hypothetical protein
VDDPGVEVEEPSRQADERDVEPDALSEQRRSRDDPGGAGRLL